VENAKGYAWRACQAVRSRAADAECFVRYLDNLLDKTAPGGYNAAGEPHASPADEAAHAPFQLTPPMSHQYESPPQPIEPSIEDEAPKPAPKPRAPRKPRAKAAKPTGEAS